MKICAIRLKEVGRFQAPIALEGLTGGLDVLAGPNELGKSTILEAVKLALFEKHSSAKKEVEALRPYAGGAPLVEVDFEIDGATWRIRKQFLSGRAAELRNLRSGQVARGGDAETELATLLAGKDGIGRFALLWVDQGAALARFNLAEAAGSSLNAAIEVEVESVADGGTARLVAARLKAELGELVTGHNPPRPAGRYKAALDERHDLAARGAAAQSRLEAAQARLDRLEAVRGEFAQLADAGAASARGKAEADSKRAFETARAAHEKLRIAEEALARHEEKFGSCKMALESVGAKIADLSKLEEAAVRDAPLLENLSKRLAHEENRTEACRRKRDEIKTALAAAERESKAHELAARAREVSERLAAARTAAGERISLTSALAANGAEDSLLAAARREAQSMATLSARLTAAAPKVSIAYAPGAAGKIKAGGRPLADGETLTPTRPIAIEIAGIGVVTVTPGQGADEDAADIAAHEAQLAALLRKIGAASLDDAEQRAAERRTLQSNLAEAGARLNALAPDGLDRLEEAHADLAARAARLGPPPTRTQAEIGPRVHGLDEALTDAEADLAGAVAARDEVRMQHVQARALSAERGAQIKALAADLGDAVARKARKEKLAAALAAAEAARNGAVRDLTAWREAAPDDARFAGLKRAAEAAESARAAADRKLADLRLAQAGIEGELNSDRAEDVAACVAELDEAFAAADARVEALEDEVAALRLLAGELERASSETRERFAKPVLDRLMPYLQRVFPDARASFGDGFALQALHRAGTPESLERLSEGTREQLAVLVRLGFGRLLAEAGKPAPLILDDALVYSDDTRIERMFEALALAARSHQVLVLTCRERAFASLGGNRIAIADWRPG